VKVVATVAMVACFTSGWLLQRQVAAGGDVYQQARLFEKVLAHVRDFGIGLLVDARNGWVTVVAPMAESPAERAGIRTGDRLLEVDGESAADWTLDQAVQAMRGTIGTAVDLAIQREGAMEPLRFRLVRERIHQRAVPPASFSPTAWGTSA
jgi:predicted metalloprotease with PDZ domain